MIFFFELDTYAISILKAGGLRHREVKELAADRTAEKQRARHWNPRAHVFWFSLDWGVYCYELAFIKHQLYAGTLTEVLRGECFRGRQRLLGCGR